MKSCCFFSIFFFFFFIFSPLLWKGVGGEAFSQPFSIFLIGDAGQDTSCNEILSLLKNELNKNTNSAVVFLGDNIYPKGFLKKNNAKHELEKKRICSQMNILKDYQGSAYFVPGNHDWRIGQPNGKKAVTQQAEFVNNYVAENSKVKNKNEGSFFPQNGESGPVSVLLSEKIRLIMIDTQWWLQPHEADKYEKNFFLMKLDSVLSHSTNNNEKVIIAAHHPVFSNGRHVKNRQPLRFLITYTPLQIFGLLGLNKLLVQDLPQPKYRKMREAYLKIFEKYPGIIYAAGHEHNLQFFRNADDFFIVSGSGSKTTLLTEKKFPSEFSYDKSSGFFRMDFLENEKFIISAYSAVNGKLEKIYSAIF